MKSTLPLLRCALGAASLLALPAFAGPSDPKVLEFDTMAGVEAPYTGATNAIRGVPGGGLPWTLDEAKGELRTDGRLEVRVRGLVLAAGANVGTNPIASFRAIVSCETIGAAGEALTTNVSTGTFPASTAGDADIEATVNLPDPCYAPIVFVTSPGGAWFAVTGR